MSTPRDEDILADMLMPNGQTVHQVARAQLAVAYKDGVMPDRFLLGGPPA